MNDAKNIGLDGKTISPVLYHRGENISLDIPFYRTVSAEGGKLSPGALATSWDGPPQELCSCVDLAKKGQPAHPIGGMTVSYRNGKGQASIVIGWNF